MKFNAIFNEWMENQFVPSAMKEEMKAMSQDDIDASFKDEPLIFGTAGYRAKTGPGPLFLNEFTYQQLAVAYGRYIQKHFNPKKPNQKPKVFVVHDNRANGDVITFAIARVLINYGIEVYLAPGNLAFPTPIVSFLAKKHKFDGAINLTASHNPKEYNGFKAYNNLGAQVTVEQAEEISSLLPSTSANLETTYSPADFSITYFKYDDIDQYFVSVTKAIGHNQIAKHDKPIVFTSHHGTCSIWAIKFLRGLGYNIVPVTSQCYINHNFENSPIMNPEDPISFDQAIMTAKECKSDIAIGVDPDGDRMAVAIKHNGKWEYLSGNETGILATHYLLKYRTNDELLPIVVSTYVTNTLINKIVENYSGMVLRTGTGFKNIAFAMEYIDPAKAQFVIGFEEAIGMCISDQIREKDGIAATALILEMYSFYKQINMDLIDVLEKQIYTKYGHWYGETISIKIPGANWQEKAVDLEELALSIKPTPIGDFNIEEVFWNEAGSCIEWKLGGDNWIKFRISGTEPKFKIYFNLYFDNGVNIANYNREKNKTTVIELTAKIKKMLKL